MHFRFETALAAVPARYVYGVIVPAANANNWVGGTNSPDATQQPLEQGGIRNGASVSGGQTVAVRQEHVWVEAWVYLSPSRGAVNKLGDAWVPLDASHKQYQYTPGYDLKTQVPFDAEAFVNAAQLCRDDEAALAQYKADEWHLTEHKVTTIFE